MKLYDFDGMFDEKLSAFISKNRGKYSETELEDIIPVLYKKFGDTVIKSIGKTPRAFYADMGDGELIKCLKTHLKQRVPVSGFLYDEIEGRRLTDLLLPLLDGTESECEFAMNLLGSDERALDKYMQLLVSSGNEDIKNKCADLIKEKADLVTDRALKNYRAGVERGYMLEIMSRSVVKRDEIFDILIKEFRSDPENLTLNAGYLAAYGDERALKYLLDRIDGDGITYVEFRELKFAIESLGGEYDKERDFSNDPYYNLIKSQPVDLFGGTEEK